MGKKSKSNPFLRDLDKPLPRDALGQSVAPRASSPASSKSKSPEDQPTKAVGKTSSPVTYKRNNDESKDVQVESFAKKIDKDQSRRDKGPSGSQTVQDERRYKPSQDTSTNLQQTRSRNSKFYAKVDEPSVTDCSAIGDNKTLRDDEARPSRDRSSSGSKRSRRESRSRDGSRGSAEEYTFSENKQQWDHSNNYQKVDKERWRNKGDNQQMAGKKATRKVIKYEPFDLFDAPADHSLAHCVGEDLAMGAGIAVEFRSRFKKVGQLCEQRVKVGGMAVIEHSGRFIYYLVTKKKSTSKPVNNTVYQSLVAMRDHALKAKVQNIAMPKIACGLDRLNWEDVEGMINQIYGDTDINIFVHEKKDSPFAEPARRFKGKLVHRVMELHSIQPQTAIVYIGPDNQTSDEHLQHLEYYDHWHPRFVPKFKEANRQMGEIVRLRFGFHNDITYGFISRERNGRINFEDFEKCTRKMSKMITDDGYSYIGIRYVDDPADMMKIENLLSYNLPDIEVWVCFPDQASEDEYLQYGDMFPRRRSDLS